MKMILFSLRHVVLMGFMITSNIGHPYAPYDLGNLGADNGKMYTPQWFRFASFSKIYTPTPSHTNNNESW